jgi:hypothetical protein
LWDLIFDFVEEEEEEEEEEERSWGKGVGGCRIVTFRVQSDFPFEG